MSSSADFGEKYSHFRFRFSINALPSRQREETAEGESGTEMMLKLSGFPPDGVMSAGWRVQPLHIPPIVSELCNIIIKIIMIFILFIDQQKRC